MNGGSDWPSTSVTLLHRLRGSAGGPEWDTFVDLYSPLLYRFCRRRGLQEADARDVAQNVFLAVRRGMETFEYDPERGRFRGWLGTIAAREIIRHQQRSQKGGQATGGGADLPAPSTPENDAVWIAEFNSHVFHTALETIRPEFSDEIWQVFEAVWIQDRPSREVAQEMNRKPEWVYRAKYNVLQRLKAEVQYLTADIAAFSKE